MKRIILFTCILVLMPVCVLAATINVPEDQANIQAAIDVANDGDTILIDDGIYTGIGNYNVNLNGKSITIKSVNGPDNCVVDCQQLGRAFFILSETVTLEGLTIKNGNSGSSSDGGDGGAVYSRSQQFTVNNCVFADNFAAYYGGAVYANLVVFSGCRFTGNRADYGGAVYSFSSNFYHCDFKDNFAANDGGVVSCSFFAFTGCIFKGNQAGSRGGAIFLRSRASQSLNYNYMINCIFSDNHSSYGGVAYILIFSSDQNYCPYFINCTFTRNLAVNQGGVVDCSISNGEQIAFKNCIIWNNAAKNGSEIYGSPVITYSDIKGGYVGSGNIDIDPQFLSIEARREFYLHPDSPCIDSGTDEGSPGDDIDGVIRPVGLIDDMGAYEFQNDIFIWEGQTSDWGSAGNWSESAVPSTNSIVIISSTYATVNPEIDFTPGSVDKLFIRSGALSIVQGKLSIGGS